MLGYSLRLIKKRDNQTHITMKYNSFKNKPDKIQNNLFTNF